MIDDVSDLPEAQYEPGSDGQVLRNRLSLTSKEDMDAGDSVRRRAMDSTDVPVSIAVELAMLVTRAFRY
ncbi:MAG: hypothetical protein NTAFB01_30470 [Nitrospira sp.]